MRVTPILLGMTVMGCGRLGFDAESPTSAYGSAPDAVQQVAHGCIDPGADTGFDNLGPGPCQPWGSSTMTNSTMVENNSELVITPSTTTGPTSYAGCYHFNNVPFVAVFANVPNVLDTGAAPDAYTTLQVFGADIHTSAGYNMSKGKLELHDLQTHVVLASQPYDPIAMRWWRIRPDDSAVIGEVSADGTDWKEFGRLAAQPPTMISINIGAGTNALDAAPTTARIASINVCPP